MKRFSLFREELKKNKLLKSKIIIILYRVPNIFFESNYSIIRFIGFPLYILNRLFLDFVMGIELNYKTKIGHGLVVYHGVGLVVNTDAVIGNNCILRNGVVIGNKITNELETGSPKIGNNVELGTSSIVIGDVIIGNDSKVGAGTIVTKDVPEKSIVIGINIIKR